MIAERKTFITLDAANVAYIAGTTTKVLEVVEAKAAHHLTPEALQRELPHLTLAQVYAALAYYHAHKPELDAQIAERYAYADGLRRANPNPWTREQLLARRDALTEPPAHNAPAEEGMDTYLRDLESYEELLAAGKIT